MTLLALLLAAPADDRVRMDARTQRAVQAALVYLQRTQGRDGSWGGTAVTALAVLAYLSNGHLPDRGPFGPTVGRAVRHLLAVGASRPDGCLAGPRDDPAHAMYHHGMATLALSQVYGMAGDDELRQTLKKAVDLTVRGQNVEGGWRYKPYDNDADVSVTIMQVMALRGAKDGGLYVPDITLKRALGYINRCFDRESGGYRYQPTMGGAGYARTAAGVCVLQLGGEYQAEQVGRAVQYLKRHREDGQYFWYGLYYAAHAFHQVGGDTWAEFYGRTKASLLAQQEDNGRWQTPSEGDRGPAYQTAIAAVVLSVPTNYLPIFQR
jgi:hypothetical protein